MDFDQLRTFLLAAELQSFTQAARRLNFSQSAISQQIRDLEDRLGVRLFERHSRSVSLTPAGERLRPRARTILKEVEDAVGELGELRGQPQGVVRIGASLTPGVYLLPHALGRFSERYPGVRASLDVLSGDELTRAMQQGDIDVALVEEDILPARVFGWERVHAITDEIVAIAPTGDPLLASMPIPLERLAELNVILRPEHSPMRQTIIDHLAAAGFNPNRLRIRFELGNTEGIKQAVQAGLGVGFVSIFALDRVHPGYERLAIEGLRITRPLWLMRPTKQRTPMPERFAELVLALDWLPEGVSVPAPPGGVGALAQERV